VFAYVGQTRAAALVRELAAAGLGECTQRGELPPRRARWFYDNGAFADWQAGRPFDVVRFSRDLVAIRNGGRGRHTFARPDFVTLPDRVADWPATRELGELWAEDVRACGAPAYLVVQDGAGLEDVRARAPRLGVAGLFVGGALDWKLRTAPAWVELAHANGWRCHVGRVGTPGRVAWAREIGADSIDSCLPLWDAGKLAGFLDALRAIPAARLF
jgi:hypothetical protein